MSHGGGSLLASTPMVVVVLYLKWESGEVESRECWGDFVIGVFPKSPLPGAIAFVGCRDLIGLSYNSSSIVVAFAQIGE